MMNRHELLRNLWGEPNRDTGLFVSLLSFVLRVLSLPYQFGVALRNLLYQSRLLRVRKLPCPVISIGNLVAGGTGKTPLTILVARKLKHIGYRPAVLSRGYGRQSEQSVGVVSDGQRMLMEQKQAGDEPYLIARLLPQIAVVVGPSRYIAGKKAIEELGADVLILDDGFQHRSLYRDLDIVLLDSNQPFSNGRLLPGGALREPPRSLQRADIVVLTGSGREAEGKFPSLLLSSFAPSSAVFRCRHEAQAVLTGSGEVLPLALLQGKKVFAFAGIGNPASFRRTLEEQGAVLSGFAVFPDHHVYDAANIADVTQRAQTSGADLIVTTEKDGTRLLHHQDFLKTIFILRIEMTFLSQEDPFFNLIMTLLGKSDKYHLAANNC